MRRSVYERRLARSNFAKQNLGGLAARRKRRRMIYLGIGAFLGLASTISLAVASHLARFEVKEIRIAGNQALPERLVHAAASAALYDGSQLPFSKTSTFFFPRKSIERFLMNAFPRLESTDVSVQSWSEGKVQIEVKERTPYALWCHAYPRLPDGQGQAGRNDDCYLLDGRGYIFAPYNGESLARDEVFHGGILRSNPLRKWFLPTYFAEVIKTIEAIESAGVHVVALDVVNEHEYTTEIDRGLPAAPLRSAAQAGAKLLMRFDQDALTVAQNFKSALASEALMNRMGDVNYVDLRFDGRVYYKYR